MAKTKEERLAARAAKNAAKYKSAQNPAQANAGSQHKNQAAPQQAQVLSPEAIQKRDLALLLKPCRSKKELNAWIKYFLDLELPDETVSRYASSNPLEAVWEMYRICVLKQNPENIQEVLYTSSRGAGKTLSVAVAEFMILLHDQRDMAHIGAIMAQAKRAFDYVQGFCNIPKIKRLIDPPKVRPEDKILQKMIMEKTIFNINGVKCTMEILPATLTSLNGLHCSLVSIDELDTLPPAGRLAIKDAAGMLDTKRGKKPLRVGISTRKSKHGIMNSMIENAEKEGRHLRFWTALEFTERCPDSRSGTTPTAYWIDGHSGEVLTPDEFDQKDESKKKNFQLETQMWENCKRCPLAVFCRGDAKKQVSQSNMLKSIDELNQKIRSEGLEWASAQLFNLRPSSEGVVYREFDEQLHIKSWNDMWLQLTGKEFPGECTHDIFIKKCHEMKLNCTAGIDWGFSNPNTVVYFFTDKRDNVYVVRADGMTQISEPMWIELLRTKYHTMYRCQLYIPDPANQGAILEMKKQGLPVVNFNKGEINAGIQVIKKFLRVPGGGKDATKVFIARDTCKPLIDEFQLYHYKVNQAGEATDTPDTEHDHWLDAFRYAMSYLYGKNTVYLADGLDIPSKAEIMTIDGSYKRMPTPAEFAAINGAPLNDQEQNIGTLGKVGTASELASDGVDDDAGSDNSFIWSF